MYSARVKSIAYKLDPVCWKSYSGQPKNFKRYMDSRRTISLEAAVVLAERYHPFHPHVLAQAILRHPIHRRYCRSSDQTDAMMAVVLNRMYPEIKPQFKQKVDPMPTLDRYAGFRMKMLMHYKFTPGSFHFFETLAQPRTRHSRFAREQTFERIKSKLIDDGLLQGRAHARGFELTKKGHVYVDAILATPLPVQAEPKWVMPSA